MTAIKGQKSNLNWVNDALYYITIHIYIYLRNQIHLYSLHFNAKIKQKCQNKSINEKWSYVSTSRIGSCGVTAGEDTSSGQRL